MIENSPDESINTQRRVAMLLHQLGTILLEQRKTEHANQTLGQCLELANSLGWTQLEANTLYQLAVNQRLIGKYQQSEKLLQRALDVARKTEDRRVRQYIEGQLTYVLISEGKLDKAASILERSLVKWEKFERASDRMLAHTTLHTLGRVRFQQRRYVESKEAFEESLRLKLLLNSGPHLTSHTKCLLAKVYIALGRYSEAESYLIESIQNCISMGDIEYVVKARKVLGLLRCRQFRYKEAEAILALAATDAKWSGNPQIRFEIAMWHILVSVITGRFRNISKDIQTVVQNILKTKISSSLASKIVNGLRR